MPIMITTNIFPQSSFFKYFLLNAGELIPDLSHYLQTHTNTRKNSTSRCLPYFFMQLGNKMYLQFKQKFFTSANLGVDLKPCTLLLFLWQQQQHH